MHLTISPLPLILIMNARTTTKKQLVSAYEVSKGTVRVAVAEFPSLTNMGNEEDVLNVSSFVAGLATSTDVNGQVRLIQARKGQMKQYLAGSDASAASSGVTVALEVLLQLYIRPAYFPLRGSLEWIVEVLSKIPLESSLGQVVRGVVRTVCSREWDALAQTAPAADAKLTDSEMNELIGNALALNTMAVLDSHFFWLQELPSSDESFAFADGSALLAFALHLARIYDHCSARISPELPELLLSSAELLKYVECSGESMRALMTVLKSRRGGYVPAEEAPGSAAAGSEEWRGMCTLLLQASARVLQSEHANKDVITFSAQCLLTVQRLLRSASDPATQLAAIVSLLSSSADASSPSAAVASLHTVVAETVTRASPMAQCALLRACLSAFDDAALLQPFAAPSAAESGALLLGPVFSFILRACNDSLPVNRLYGFQTLESWLARLLSLPAQALFSSSAVFAQVLANTRFATAVLTKAWSHPSRQVNHLVPNIYAKLVHAVDALQQSSTTMATADADAGALAARWWNALLEEALAMPAHHRGRYQALNSLLPFMRADRILQAQANIVCLLISAVGTRDIASAASGFLSSLLGDLYAAAAGAAGSCATEGSPQDSLQDADLRRLREIWRAPVIAALCDEQDYKLRTHVAEYLLPELVKVDPSLVPFAAQAVRDSAASLHCKLWGIVSFTLQARLKGLPGQVTGTAGAATAQELRLACISADSELRLIALTALVASSRSAAPIDVPDMRILRETLRHSLKNSDADHRHKVVRIVKSLFLRLKESSRVSERDLVKLEKQIQFTDGKGKKADAAVEAAVTPADGKKHKSRKLQQLQQAAMTAEECVEAMATARRVIQDSYDACAWLASELLDNLYPGASCDREVMSLDLLSAMIEAMGADSAQMQSVYSEHMIRTLINLFISSWDRSRRMAADLLLQLPRPLTGYTTPETAGALLKWGLELAGSAKLRESDAGALLVRDMYVVYAADLKWDLSKHIFDAGVPAILPSAAGGDIARCGEFVSSLCDRWNAALTKLDEVFSAYNMSALLSSNQQYPYQSSGAAAEAAAGSDASPAAMPSASFPLCHGLLLALRFCLMESQKAGVLEGDKIAFWRPIVARIYAYALQSLNLAMTIVAEAPSDVPFAPVPISSKGPVNPASAAAVAGGGNKSMAASYINTNSTMGTGGDGENADGGATAQRAVVAAWLLVKESASLLSLLVSVSPPSGELLLTEDEISQAGSLILDALGRLKHMGAISEAQQALQSIATTLLRHGSKSPSLCRLPSRWLSLVLGRLSGDNQQQQVFILRRSAGFAYSFLSLLRAEPLNCAPTLLPVAMESLLRTVRVGLEDAQNYTDGTDDDGDAASKWKLAVHALNVLRLILSDAALGPDLNTYVAETAQLAVSGFTAPQWAVRNSCMMVFTAVAQRAVGTDKNDSAGAAVPTISEFFQRFPALEPFLLNALTVATSSQDGVHPTLYPLMLLIAKLRVSVLPEEGTQGTADTTAQLIALADRCTGQKVQAVRVIAAKALKVLTPVSLSPSAAATRLAAATAMVSKPSSGRLNLNALHGQVVGVRELVRSTCTYVEANAHTNAELVATLCEQTASTVLPALRHALEVLGDVRCAAVHIPLLETVRFVRTILSASETAQAAQQEAECLLVQACRQVLPAVYLAGLVDSKVCILPFEPWLWRECMDSLVHLSLCCEPSTAAEKQLIPVEMVAELMGHRVSEVREGALRGLLAWHSASAANGLPDAVLERLLQRVAVETEPPVAQLAMQLFTSVIGRAPLSSYSAEMRGVFHEQGSSVFDALSCGAGPSSAAPSLKQNSSAQAALEISGWIIADRLQQATVSASDVRWIERWVQVLESACPDDQTVALRLSAARSLQHAGLLSASRGSRASRGAELVAVTLRASLVALTLLQDDDDDVREVVNTFLVPSASVPGDSSGEWTVPAGFCTTEEFSLRALSATIAASIVPSGAAGVSAVWQALQVSILGKESERVPIAALIRSDSAALSQKIFEAEQDNLYIEHISAGKVLVSALRIALAAPGAVDARSLADAVAHCTAAAGHYKSLLADAEGQSTYQPTLFRYFFLSFHLARAVVQSADMGDELALEQLREELLGCAEGGAAVSAGAVRLHPWITAELRTLL